MSATTAADAGGGATLPPDVIPDDRDDNARDDEHPLQNEWVLWEHRAAAHSGNKNPNQWKDNMIPLCDFKTVEQFWRNFNHIPKPSEVFFADECRKKVGPEGKTVEEYSLFKRGIEPEWGDPQNVIGGEWFCRQYFEPELLDLYWQNLVLGVVGETIEDGVDTNHSYQDVINGARVVDKSRNMPTYKFELWVNTRDTNIKERLRQRLEECMIDGQPAKLKGHPKFEWKDHTA